MKKRTGMIPKGVFIIAVFLIFCVLVPLCFATEKGQLTLQAEKLFLLEKRYMKALMKKDYQALYDLQHPLFKALVSFSLFKENEGRVLLNMGKFDKVSQLPGIYTYHPFLRSKLVDFNVDSVSIDESGKYSKVETFISQDVSYSLPVPPPMIISNKVPHYWEKIGDSWVFLSKYLGIPAIHISGDMTGYDDRERRLLLPEEYAEYMVVLRKDQKP
ncbi:MAG: hypothetical protein ACE5FU_00455 [Nitrospinota bacterium]